MRRWRINNYSGKATASNKQLLLQKFSASNQVLIITKRCFNQISTSNQLFNHNNDKSGYNLKKISTSVVCGGAPYWKLCFYFNVRMHPEVVSDGFVCTIFLSWLQSTIPDQPTGLAGDCCGQNLEMQSINSGNVWTHHENIQNCIHFLFYFRFQSSCACSTAKSKTPP